MIITAPHERILEMSANWISQDEKRVLEIFCHRGEFADYLRKRNIKNYVGTDPLQRNVDIANLNISDYRFLCVDIRENYHYLRKVSLIVAFNYLQTVRDDLELINNIKPNTKLIFSVPNIEVEGCKRWYDLEGWEERFKPYININKIITFQNPLRKIKQTFLFKGTRNEYIVKNKLQVFQHVKFDMTAKMIKGR